MNKSRLPAFLLFFFVTFLSVCLASIFARHNNTLLKSGRWYSEKAALPYSVLGSQAFMLSRKALAENDVDLATWHGYQEIISNPEFTADAVEFDFLLKDSHYFSFHYNRSDSSFDGFTISANPFTKSQAFHANSSNEFESKQEFTAANLKLNSWNHAQVKFGPEFTELFVNGSLIPVKLQKANASQKIGFRGSGYTGSKIDSVKVSLKQDGIWREAFDNRQMFLPAFGCFYILTSLLVVLTLYIKRRSENIFFPVLAGLASASLTSLVLLLADVYVAKNFYFPGPSWVEYMQTSINSEFTNFYNGIDSRTLAVTNAFKQEYFSPAHSKKYKIILIGTSQTWGSGASRHEATIGGQLNRMISSSGFTDTAQVFTLAVSGSKLFEMKDLFYQSVNSQFPDMVVLNFGVNDDNSAAFKKDFEEFIFELKKNRVRVLLSAEPRFGDLKEFKYDNSYSEIAERTGSLYLNLTEYLDSKRNDGHLCWDAVHFSDYGQRLIAEQMFDKIKFEIPVKEKYLANKN